MTSIVESDLNDDNSKNKLTLHNSDDDIARGCNENASIYEGRQESSIIKDLGNDNNINYMNNDKIGKNEKSNNEKYKKNYETYTNDWTYNQKVPGRPYYLFENEDLSKFKKDKPWW